MILYVYPPGGSISSTDEIVLTNYNVQYLVSMTSVGQSPQVVFQLVNFELRSFMRRVTLRRPSPHPALVLLLTQVAYVGFWGIEFRYAYQHGLNGNGVAFVDVRNCTFKSHGGRGVAVRTKGFSFRSGGGVLGAPYRHRSL